MKKIINILLSILICATCITVSNVSVSAAEPYVGKLKIIARYDNSMTFYDGHTYLAFTSYIDGVQIPFTSTSGTSAIYAAYDIDDSFYEDLGDVGTNQKSEIVSHRYSDTNADEYFNIVRNCNQNVSSDGTEYLEVNRGEIVTIGAYRDFDMSITEAILGTVTNSTLYGELNDNDKASLVQAAKNYLNNGKHTLEGFKNALAGALAKTSIEYDFDTKGFSEVDGIVDGGLCLNRELYNQKYKYDQYKNATYEVEITQSELNNLIESIRSGDYNKFSFITKSCAVSAIGLWNATFADRPELKLNINADDQLLKAITPAIVKTAIINQLHGQENPGGSDDGNITYGGKNIYVTAPSKSLSNTYNQNDSKLKVDTTNTSMRNYLIGTCSNSGLASGSVTYNIQVNYSKTNDSYGINGIEINGNTTTKGGVYLTYNIGAQYKNCRVINETQGECQVLSVDDNGYVSFLVNKFGDEYAFIGIEGNYFADLGYELGYGETGEVMVPGYDKCSNEELESLKNTIDSLSGVTLSSDNCFKYISAEVTSLKVSDLDEKMQSKLPTNAVVLNIKAYDCYDLFDTDGNYLFDASASGKTNITDLDDKSVTISIPLNEEQISMLGNPDNNYNYYALREHDGKYELLECTYQNVMGVNVVNITSNKFSNFAIYRVKKNSGGTNNHREVVNTSVK